MKAEGRVGIISASTGSLNPLRQSTDGSLIVKNGSGKYMDAAQNGRLFYVANQTPVNTSTTLNTTFTGLGIANPTGSGKLIILHEFGYAQDNASAAGNVLALASTDTTGFTTTALAPVCCRHAYATSIAIIEDDTTIAAPVIIKVIGAFGNSATTTWPNVPSLVDLGGSIVIPEGRAIVTDTTVAVGATTIQFSFMWEEISA